MVIVNHAKIKIVKYAIKLVKHVSNAKKHSISDLTNVTDVLKDVYNVIDQILVLDVWKVGP